MSTVTKTMDQFWFRWLSTSEQIASQSGGHFQSTILLSGVSVWLVWVGRPLCPVHLISWLTTTSSAQSPLGSCLYLVTLFTVLSLSLLTSHGSKETLHTHWTSGKHASKRQGVVLNHGSWWLVHDGLPMSTALFVSCDSAIMKPFCWHCLGCSMKVVVIPVDTRQRNLQPLSHSSTDSSLH